MNKEIANKITYCQHILDMALEVLPKQKNIELFEKTLDVISMINQHRIMELSDRILKIMGIKDLRSLAIESLELWLQMPCFKEQSYEIFLSNTDSEVKFSALLSWASYYRGTKDPVVLEKLYVILINEHQPVPIRSIAFTGILNVSGFGYKRDDLSMANLMNISSNTTFNEQINWSIIIKLLKTHAPKVLKIRSINKVIF